MSLRRTDERLSPAERLRRQSAGARRAGTHADGPWAALSRLYTERAHLLTGSDLFVYVAPGAADGTYGLCYPATGRIELNGEMLGDLDDGGLAERLVVAEGILRHEIGHAEHSRLRGLNDALATYRGRPGVGETAMLLEEIRMEAHVVADRPADAEWIRAAAATLIPDAPAAGDAFAGAWTACLTEGRVAAGTLQSGDVTTITATLDTTLDASVRAGLAGLWPRVCGIADDDPVGLVDAAVSMLDLLGLTGAEDGFSGGAPGGGEDGEGDEGGGSAGGTGSDALTAVRDALAAAVGEDRDRLAEALAGTADEVAGTPNPGRHGRGGGSSRVRVGLRPPTATERTQRLVLAHELRRARVRDRDVTTVRAAAPPGRLVMRTVVQAEADRAAGRRVTAEPWKRKRRTSVPSPRLRLAALVDASGSMAADIDAACGALWATAAAVIDTGGQVSAVAFGESAVVLGTASHRAPEGVHVTAADGGWEAIGDALALGCDDFTVWDGPTLVVVISDGHWVDAAQDRAGRERIAALRAAGTAVVQVGIGGLPVDAGADELVAIDDPAALGAVLGRACVRALGG